MGDHEFGFEYNYSDSESEEEDEEEEIYGFLEHYPDPYDSGFDSNDGYLTDVYEDIQQEPDE